MEPMIFVIIILQYLVPSEIIEGSLWIGSSLCAKNKKLLLETHITHVLVLDGVPSFPSVSDQSDQYLSPGIILLWMDPLKVDYKLSLSRLTAIFI